MSSRSDAPTVLQRQPTNARFALGDRVTNDYHGACRGTVAAVGETTVGVKWDDGNSPIVYPIDADYLRRLMPWET